MARWLPPAFKDGLDIDAIDGAIDFPYDTPNLHVEYVRAEPPGVPTCFWRSVGPGHNIFVVESFVDELAHAAGQDPVAFRRAHLAKEPRLLACLDLAAEKAGWGSALPARVGRGVACQSVFGSYVAAIVEAEVDNDGEIAIRRVTAAVDCGTVVNPDSVEAQIQGGLIFGLTAALYNEITIAKGRVQQSNFNNYRMMRINETPAIEVHLVRNGEAPGGIGEPGTSIAAPALANALFAATGVRLRSLPDRPQATRVRGKPREDRLAHPARGGRARGRRRSRLRRLESCLAPGRPISRAADRVALSDYKQADPTGVPGEPQGREPHRPGALSHPRRRLRGLPYGDRGATFRRRSGVRPALRHDLFDQHHARQGDRHRPVQRLRIFWRRSIAASGVTARRFTPRCPSPATPI